jgi:peptidoglycan/xylan/chitin deacetylase (PgdA/CDA1 family)
MLPTHGRYAYSPIVARPSYRWPNGTRLAVYVALGLEHYAFDEGMAENLVEGVPRPDVLNASWRDYGNRVGAWRILSALAEYRLPAGILLNTALFDHAPELVAACRNARCEIIAHGRSNSDLMAEMSEAQERSYIRGVTERIVRETGERPGGWASPWIAETSSTPDLLEEAGYRYLLDWCMDDQPVWLKTRGRPILSVPYSQELNDSSAIIGRRVAASQFADMIVDQFDEMLETSSEEPLVMSVILHAFIAGQPFRLRALRSAFRHIASRADVIWLTQPGAICAHVAATQPSA